MHIYIYNIYIYITSNVSNFSIESVDCIYIYITYIYIYIYIYIIYTYFYQINWLHSFSITWTETSLELSILWISSVKTLCLSLLNLCCIVNIDLVFLMNCLWFFLRLSILILLFSKYVILFSSWVASKRFLKFSNLSFLFMTHFLFLLLLYLHYRHLLSNFRFLLLV